MLRPCSGQASAHLRARQRQHGAQVLLCRRRARGHAHRRADLLPAGRSSRRDQRHRQHAAARRSASCCTSPWGETRFTTGTTPTTWRFTGQREDATIGLYFYNARYLDPQLGRFIQPDTIVPAPGNPQALNRYSYVLNNPLRYTDPSGHVQVCAEGDAGGGCGSGANTSQIWQVFANKRSPLLDYYALLHQLTQAQASAASAVELEALAGAVESAYAAGSAWLPQHQFDPAMVVEPASLVSLGGAITSGGMRALGGAIGRLPGSWLDYVPARYRSSVADAFAGAPVASVTTTDMIVYRQWGGGADETGSPWFSPKPYTRPGNAQRYLALPEYNSAQNVSVFRIPAGTTIVYGKVASQAGQVNFGSNAVGGGAQVYLPNPSDAILLGPLNVSVP
ncbi:MAG: RHS repeat-associated core domain-containing protein [Anaerolineae bacterium]